MILPFESVYVVYVFNINDDKKREIEKNKIKYYALRIIPCSVFHIA